MGIFDIGHIFVVGDDGHRVLSPLQVLAPFLKCKDDC